MVCTVQRASKSSDNVMDRMTVKELRKLARTSAVAYTDYLSKNSQQRNLRQELCRVVKKHFLLGKNMVMTPIKSDVQLHFSPFTYDGEEIDAMDIQKKRNIKGLAYNGISFSDIYADQSLVLKKVGIRYSEDADVLEHYSYSSDRDAFAMYYHTATNEIYMITFRVTGLHEYKGVKKSLLASQVDFNISNVKKENQLRPIIPKDFVKIY